MWAEALGGLEMHLDSGTPCESGEVIMALSAGFVCVLSLRTWHGLEEVVLFPSCRTGD